MSVVPYSVTNYEQGYGMVRWRDLLLLSRLPISNESP
jgi:hypothetical protein